MANHAAALLVYLLCNLCVVAFWIHTPTIDLARRCPMPGASGQKASREITVKSGEGGGAVTFAMNQMTVSSFVTEQSSTVHI